MPFGMDGGAHLYGDASITTTAAGHRGRGSSTYVDESGPSAYADEVLATVDVEQAIRGADLDTGLRAIARLRRLTESLEAETVTAARRAGWSWQDIAARLGVSKQTVHRKYHQGQKDRG
jgi:DNA-directed RNA polymerase specialized sigma24 family protein